MLKEQPCNVRARPGKTRDVTERNRVIVDRQHDDGDVGGCSGDGVSSGRTGTDDSVHVQTDKFESKVGEAIELSFGVPELDDDTLAIDIAEVAQSLFKSLVYRG